MVDLLEPTRDRTVEGVHETRLVGVADYRCTDCRDDDCQRVVGDSLKAKNHDDEMGA